MSRQQAAHQQSPAAPARRTDEGPELAAQPEAEPAAATSPEDQAALLARANEAQRQALLGQIGQIHGNRQAQRVVSLLQRAEAPARPRTISAEAPAAAPEGGEGEQEAETQPAEARQSLAPPGAPPPEPPTPPAPPAPPASPFGIGTGLLQAALSVSQPDDPYEREAERVADQVMRAPDPAASNALWPTGGLFGPPPTPAAAPTDGATPTVTPEIEGRIQTLRGGGSPLPPDERTFFEGRFGHDFGAVRIHSGDNAAGLARSIQARAFTIGSDIAFGQGEYQPGSDAGRHLMAHELTHVVQQTGPGPARSVQRATLEETLAEAETTLSPADIEQEQAAEVETTPVTLEDPPAETGGTEGAGGDAAPADADAADAAPDAAPAGGDAAPAPDAAPAAGDAAPAAATADPAARRGAAAPITPNLPATSGAAAPQPPAVGDTAPAADTADAAPDGDTAPVQTQNIASPPQNIASPPQNIASPLAPDADAADAAGDAAPAAGDAADAAPAPDAAPVQTQNIASPPQNIASPPQNIASPPAPAPDTAPAAPAPIATPAPAPAADPAFHAVVGAAQGAATSERAHPAPEAKAGEAAAAAAMPAVEREGRAAGRQAGEIGAATVAQEAQAAGGSPPGFNKAAFVAAVKAKIDQLTPKEPSKMEQIEGSGVFDGVKQAVDTQVAGGKQAAQGTIDDKVAETPDPSAVPEKPVTPLRPNEPGAPPAQIATDGAAPKNKGPGAVETPIKAASAELDAQLAAGGVTEEQLEKSNEPAFTGALEEKRSAQAHAAAAPAAYRAGERQTIDTARGEAADTAQTQLTAMHSARAGSFGAMDGLQQAAQGRDEGERARIGQQINQIFDTTKGKVDGILQSLDGAVDSVFRSGADAAKNSAIEYIRAETKKYKDQRYARDRAWYEVGAHIEGALTHLGDALTDMPPEYYEIYKRGRDRYGVEMTKVLERVAEIVADHLARAKQAIEEGRRKIDEFVANQPAALQDVARQAADDARGRFDQLEQDVDAKQNELVDRLAQSYMEKQQELDSALDAMKSEERGLLARAGDAIGGVLRTIEELRTLLTSSLQRAAGAIGLILADPIGFLGNLIEGVKQGLLNFVGNIGSHLQRGLIDWLTGAVANAGIQLPQSFDLPGIFSLVMQLLGLTAANIRAQIVRALGPQGETIVGALEQAAGIFDFLRKGDIAGLWEHIKEQIGDLKSMVLDEIKSMVSEQVIKAGIDWLIGLLGGPAGAFVKAVQGIVRIVTWLVNNGSRLLALVNSVIDSITAIARGNVGGAAQLIENSLARALPMVISFLADLLGLGGISKKIQAIIQKIQAPINRALQWVVQKAKALAKKIGGLFGLGKEGNANQSSTDSELERRKELAIADSETLIDREGITLDNIRDQLPTIQNTHNIPSLSIVVNEQAGNFFIQAKRKTKVKRIPGKLTKNMPSGAVENHQAHHLIPFAVARDHQLTREGMRRGIWDLDNGDNGISLPCNEEGKEVSPHLPLHSGSHPQWNTTVIELLNSRLQNLIDKYGNLRNAPDGDITQRLNAVQTLLRRRIKQVKGKLS